MARYITGSYNIDKYLLPNFINLPSVVFLISTSKHIKYIINNSRKMEKYSGINKIYKNYFTTLGIMCGENNIYCAKLLIKFGAKINKISDSKIALISACKFGKLNYAEFLVNFGFDINIENDSGTALHYASYFGHDDCVSLLINNKINLDIQDMHGFTALHDACAKNEYKCAKLLLDTNININLLDKNYRTALDLAVEKGHQECIDLFRKK
jgi:ankyrin repeat protein